MVANQIMNAIEKQHSYTIVQQVHNILGHTQSILMFQSIVGWIGTFSIDLSCFVTGKTMNTLQDVQKLEIAEFAIPPQIRFDVPMSGRKITWGVFGFPFAGIVLTHFGMTALSLGIAHHVIQQIKAYARNILSRLQVGLAPDFFLLQRSFLGQPDNGKSIGRFMGTVLYDGIDPSIANGRACQWQSYSR